MIQSNTAHFDDGIKIHFKRKFTERVFSYDFKEALCTQMYMEKGGWGKHNKHDKTNIENPNINYKRLVKPHLEQFFGILRTLYRNIVQRNVGQDSASFARRPNWKPCMHTFQDI